MMKILIANDSPASRAAVPSAMVGSSRGIGSRSPETPAPGVNSNRAWRRWFSTSLGVNTAIAIFNAILIGVLWNAVIGLVQTERQDAIRVAIDRNDNLAVAFEQYTVRTLESANAVIQQMIRAYVGSGGRMGLETFVADFTVDDKAIIGVVLADEHGTAKTSAYLGKSVKPINVADREHFRVHIEHDSGKVFVGKPVVGRLTGQWVVPVTRRINKADGTFDGVAMALIEPARFTAVLHDAKLRPLDVISLVGLDGITRARLKGATASTGEDIGKSPLFAERVRRPVGNFFSKGQLDDVPRFFSYRTLPEHQVMTIVGTAEADVTAESHRRRTQYFWAAGLTSAFIAGFAILLMLALASQRRAVTSIARSQARFLATFNQAAVGIAHSDPDGRYLAVNQKFCAILGYSKEELLARTFSDVTHPDDIHSITDSRRQLLVEPGETGVLALEKRCIRKDGAIVWCAITMSVVHDGSGQVDYVLVVIRDISDRKQGETRIRHLNRVYAVLSGINALIVRVRDRQELLDAACRIAVEHGHFEMAWIGAFDPATQDVTPVAWAGENADELTRAKSSARDDTPRGKGAVGQAIRERRPVFNNDIATRSFGGPREKEILRLGFRSQITLPLYEGHAVAATLTMYAREPNFFDDEEIRLLTQLAGDISFALENITKQQKLEKLSRIRAVSSEINAAIVRIREPEALLRETCRIAAEHGKFELVWIALLDHEKQEVRPVAWTGFSPEAAHAVNSTTISTMRGALGAAILTRKAAVRNDTPSDLPVGKLRQEALQKGCLSCVCLPLVVDDDVVALIALYAPGVGFFDDEELALLNEVAADVSFALLAIKKQEKLEYLSYYDVLTGLPNRTLFVDRLSQQMRTRGGEQQMVAVIVIDIERFRNINESLGYRGGDEILSSIAQRLEHAFHGKDYLARISSNGFGAVVRGMKDVAGVAHLVEIEVFSCFSQPFVVSDRELRVSVKAGIALFPVDGENADNVFRNAEAALKRAKASGQRYLFYRSEMNARVAETLQLENKLRQALDREQFVLHYQPKLNLATGTISGLEALIRWNDPETGLVPPLKFIPLLEETGMILEAGRWAMQQAVADYREWSALGLQPPRIAVNVSSIQLRQKDFVEVVRDVIGEAGAAPHGLDLEITESLIMEDIEGNIEKLRAVRDMGVNIAIDDFGTGYSSLRYLAKLPVNALKIDRSFIITMTGSADSMTIVSTIISLAHALNLNVIAEGVDAEEQRKLLRLLKCDEMQGYLFSRPVPRGDVLALLQADSTVCAAPVAVAASTVAVQMEGD